MYLVKREIFFYIVLMEFIGINFDIVFELFYIKEI